MIKWPLPNRLINGHWGKLSIQSPLPRPSRQGVSQNGQLGQVCSGRFPRKAFPYKASAPDEIIEAVACAMAPNARDEIAEAVLERWPLAAPWAQPRAASHKRRRLRNFRPGVLFVGRASLTRKRIAAGQIGKKLQFPRSQHSQRTDNGLSQPLRFPDGSSPTNLRRRSPRRVDQATCQRARLPQSNTLATVAAAPSSLARKSLQPWPPLWPDACSKSLQPSAPLQASSRAASRLRAKTPCEARQA